MSGDSFSEDFLAFNASTPLASPAHPRGIDLRRGGNNRQDNWKQFGRHSEQQQGNPGDYQRSPNRGNFYAPPPNFRGNFRGYRGNRGYHSPNFRGRSPHRGKNSRGGGRGFNRGRGARGGIPNDPFLKSDDVADYVHPSMLENPWKNLEDAQNSSTLGDDESVGNVSLSSSMIPQVGDSIFEREARLNPAPDVSVDNLDVSDVSRDFAEDSMSTSDAPERSDWEGSNDGKGVPMDQEGKVISPPTEGPIRSDIDRSDSMIPLVGDSILEQSVSNTANMD